jgi:hypothetical protein
MLCCIIAVSVGVISSLCNYKEDVPTRGSLETTSTYVFFVNGSITTQHPSNLASNPVNSSAVRLIVSSCEIQNILAHWQVFLKPLIVSEIFSNRFRSKARIPPLTSRASKSDESASSGDPDFAMMRNVSASNTATSTARHRSRRYVKWVVMRLILGTSV